MADLPVPDGDGGAATGPRRAGASELRIHLAEDPGHLHPMLHPTRSGLRVVAGTVFETLIRYRPPAGGSGAGPGHYEPGLARHWKVSPGGRELRFELEPEATFHDGRNVSAVDVQFSIDAARHPRVDAPHHRRALAEVTSVEITGPKSVRVRLSENNGYVLRELAEVPILPEHVYEGRVNATSGPLVGSGPYVVERVGGDGAVLVANPDYWGPKPTIDRVTFVRESDAARALIAAKDGQIDLIPELIPAHVPGQLEVPSVAVAFEPIRWRPGTFRYAVVNCTEPPFDDARVRRAVSLLAPRDQMIERYRGLARAVTSPVWPGGPGDGDAPPVPGTDQVELAGQLLDQAGWRHGGSDGVRERDGRRLMVTVLATEDDVAERTLLIAALKKAGFVIDLRVGTSGVLLKRLRDGHFDLAMAEWAGIVDRDLTPLLGSHGKLNHGRCSSAQIDSLLERLRRAPDPGARAPIAAQLARELAEWVPVVGLVAPEPVGLVRRSVTGAVPFGAWIAVPELALSGSVD